MRRLLPCLLLTALAACGQNSPETADAPPGLPTIEKQVADLTHLPGFLDLYWDEEQGKLLVAVEDFDTPFIYYIALARGVGSNDLNLDRGQLGLSRLVRFQRSGPRVLLIQDNTGYVANSHNPAERRAVETSFARSVLGGFDAVAQSGERLLVDATAFFLRDAHGLGAKLRAAGEGDYRPDASRSAIFLPQTRSFPDNTEVEAVVSLTGRPEGPHLPTVTPDATTLTVHQHHSFVRLPPPGYEPLAFDPRSGFMDPSANWTKIAPQDYATGLGESLVRPLALRFRLQKTDPSAEISEAVEPIVFYVDPGAPEPIRSALIEGASWWAEAFEAAGFRDAYRVELLPPDADPLDIRYNVIQWVHRATRGWSYGTPIADPRTGEILKGQVSLGSLRVRHDYLLAEGLLSPYEDESVPEAMSEFALARIRQLSAHEVGHTLGLDHNFAASIDDRPSVMDYPFPRVKLDENGEIDISDAYGVGLGDFDRRAIEWGYRQFADEAATAGREQIIRERIDAGLIYVSDNHGRSDPYARYPGAAHPLGNLWDSGDDPIAELDRLIAVRARVLEQLSERAIRHGRPLATVENALVPMYLLHRFQIKAAAKSLGGQTFTYALRGDGQIPVIPVPPAAQRGALDVLLRTLEPGFLRLRPELVALIPPHPGGRPPSRETFPRHTGYVFDPLTAAGSAAGLTLDELLDPMRAARMINAHSQDPDQPGFGELVDRLMGITWYRRPVPAQDTDLQQVVNEAVLERLMAFADRPDAMPAARAIAYDRLVELTSWLEELMAVAEPRWRAHYRYAGGRLQRFLQSPTSIPPQAPLPSPPGSPIGG